MSSSDSPVGGPARAAGPLASAAAGAGRRRDGDGWVTCALGHRHWGRFGAAGLLLWHRDGEDRTRVLMQHRAGWSHHGGTWGLLGGARDSTETSPVTALREAAEEGGIDPRVPLLVGLYSDEHGGWAYDTVLAPAPALLPAAATGGESVSVEWMDADAVDGLPLHPGFAQTWPLLRDALARLVIVVDGANVIGARPDGWWRDRAGAAWRLRERLSKRFTGMLPDDALPAGFSRPRLTGWWPEVVLVLEGAARPAARPVDDLLDHPPVPGERGELRVVAAPGSGDDEIVALIRDSYPGEQVLVVTADRGLRERCTALGAQTVGPSWLLALLDR
jgi:8-oxo-dGTP diphosphatase